MCGKLAYIIFDNTVKHQLYFKCSHSDLKPFFHVKICNYNYYI